MKKNLTLSFIGGIVISAIALYLAFRHVPFAELIHYLATINYIWVFPSVFIVIICFVLRAMRWRIILESSRKISIQRAYHPMIIGFMMNCVLPGRVGELARPAILKKKENIAYATGLATVAAERVFDICLLVLFFVITFGAIHISSDFNLKFGGYSLNREDLEATFGWMAKMGVVLIAGIVLISIGYFRKLINSLIMSLPKLFFFTGEQFKAAVINRVSKPLTVFVENFAQGFLLVRYPKKLFACIILSLLIWGLSALSFYLFSLGSPGIDLTFLELSAVMVIIMFFIALPSVPGFWGLWEAGGVFALSLFGISVRDAAGFTLANHAVQMFPVIIMGFISAIIISVNIWQLSYKKEKYLENNVSNKK
jgi:uncharacterized protein (TIRG00374 family)